MGTMLTEVQLRTLAAHEGDPVVSSVYLDADGRHRPVRADVAVAFECLADHLRSRAAVDDDPRVSRAILADVARMRDWLASDWDRTATRGLALFASSHQGWFEAVRLGYAVADAATFGPHPRVAPLAASLDASTPVVVALVDRRRLRVLRVAPGEAVEGPGLDDVEERSVDTDVELGSFEHRAEEAARAHARRGAMRVEQALLASPAACLVLGGPDEAVAALQEQLPRQARQRLVGRVPVAVSAPIADVVGAALEVEGAARSRHEAESVEELRQRAVRGHRGVVGLEATLGAIEEHRVDKLLVSDGFAVPGGRCPSCGHLGVGTRQCTRCGSTNVVVGDVVELAVEEALAQHAVVEFCHTGGLDRFGRIGAIERY
jgi:hypothetical protein